MLKDGASQEPHSSSKPPRYQGLMRGWVRGFEDFVSGRGGERENIYTKLFISSNLKKITKMRTLYTGWKVKERKGPTYVE
jgi:hypothetical protein